MTDPRPAMPPDLSPRPPALTAKEIGRACECLADAPELAAAVALALLVMGVICRACEVQ